MDNYLIKLQYWRLYLLTLVAGLGGTFQYGIQISIISSPAVHIQKFVNDTWISRYGVPVADSTNQLIWSFIVAILSIGAMVGALCTPWLTIKYGRKKTFLIIDVVAVVAALFMVFSRMAKSFEMILLGRFLFGYNIAIGICVHLMYLVESSPKKLRGVLTLTCAVFLAFGKVVGAIVCIRELLGTEEMWPYLLAISGIPAVLQFVMLLFFPEAPRYTFIDKGDTEGTTKALEWLWQEDDLKQELEDMQKDKEQSQGQRAKTVRDVLTSRCVRWQLLVLVIPCAANQLSGFNALYFYASDIFHESGVQGDKIHYLAIGMGLTEFLAVTLSILYIDRVGRKRMLGYGNLMMAVTMCVLTGTLSYKHLNSMMPYVNIALIFCVICIYGLGPSAVRLVLPGELFLQAWRPAAYSVAGIVSWVTLFLVGLSFGYIVDGLGQYCFLIFVVYCILSGTFLLYFGLETKGKTMVEITKDFNKLNFKNKSDDNESTNTDFTNVTDITTDTTTDSDNKIIDTKLTTDPDDKSTDT